MQVCHIYAERNGGAECEISTHPFTCYSLWTGNYQIYKFIEVVLAFIYNGPSNIKTLKIVPRVNAYVTSKSEQPKSKKEMKTQQMTS